MRRDAHEQRRLRQALQAVTAAGAVALQLAGQLGVGRAQELEERRVERLQAAHAVQIGKLEPGHAELQVPGAGFLTGIFGQML